MLPDRDGKNQGEAGSHMLAVSAVSLYLIQCGEITCFFTP